MVRGRLADTADAVRRMASRLKKDATMPTVTLQHDMRPTPTPDEAARARFVSGLRSFVLNDLAADLKSAYDRRAAPAYAAQHGAEPATSDEAHHALKGDVAFATYSTLRVAAQKMVWGSVAEGVDRDAARLASLAADVVGKPGALSLDPDLDVPHNVRAIDVHLMPGSYTGTGGLAPGATYDRGLAVFSMGLMGANLDDIGLSMAHYVQHRYPDFAPADILDLGCTVGHNSLPWKHAYPDAKLTGIDAAAPCLEYASARAKLQDVDADFVQMRSDALAFPDASFDLVFSSMFLHELPPAMRRKTLQDAYRVLRPGGLMLHMELPPNDQMPAFEGFYLDWDSAYNAEPFYKNYRDQSPPALCEAAGFAREGYFQFVVPSLGIYGAEAIDAGASADVGAATTGRLTEGVMWFGYGAWK